MTRLTPIFKIAAALHHGHDDQLLVVCGELINSPNGSRALVQDVLRLCHLFCGFPKVVRALNLISHEFGFAAEADFEATQADPANGKAMFAEVYGTDTDPVLQHLRRVDPIFLDWVIEHAYGTTFGATDLDLEERERLSVVALSACGCWQQARSHIRACLRHGVSEADLLADLERVAWLSTEQQDLAATCISTENEGK
jgi:alkylhydroperoxidase/carboxymuconolactone decarboxylase family protein YurZ